MNKVQQLTCELQETVDPGEGYDIAIKLWKLAANTNKDAVGALLQYVKNGLLSNVRTHLVAKFANDYTFPYSKEMVDAFEFGLHDNALRYWSILGIAKAKGSASYLQLHSLALDSSLPVESRAHAVQVLSRLSHQPFNRGLSKDPGNWKEDDLRIEELQAWKKDGFPQGVGVPRPPRDSALDTPTTDFEKTVAAFDQRLSTFRANDPDDLIDPSNYLAPGRPEDINAIRMRWKLPTDYAQFLERFSPHKIICELRLAKASDGLTLYGAENLIEKQKLYSTNTLTGLADPEWPGDLLVIGDIWCDPVVLDLAKSNGKDAPVLTADHEAPEWEFAPLARSFQDLIKSIRVT